MAGMPTSTNRNSNPVLQYFPYPQARIGQAELLQTLQKLWNQYDVFVCTCPTSFGKTAVIRTLQRWLYSASAITPTNMLVDQFLGEFPDAPTLHRLDSYECAEWQTSCAAHRGRTRAFCKGCPASSDLATAKYRRGPGIYNYYTYLAHRTYRDTLIVDEAHNLVPTLQDRLSEIVWLHDYPELRGTTRNEVLAEKIEKLPKRKRQHKKIAHLFEACTSAVQHHVIQRKTQEFNGKGTKRGEPEERACIKLFPVDVGDSFSMFAPSEVQKVVLLSATIGPVDVAELGLQHRRVCYLNATHPIPAEQRPVQLIPVADLNYSNLESNVPALAEEIEQIANYHTGEKGIIHATYQLSEMLSAHLSGSRYMFHTRANKREQYERFREAPANSGAILVASGMYEGIDLPDDAGRWQVIAKCPWPSLGDPAIKYKAEQNPDWYKWQCLKDLIQACGRICRTETDFGCTYVLDSSAQRLIDSSGHLIPQWFRDALV